MEQRQHNSIRSLRLINFSSLTSWSAFYLTQEKIAFSDRYPLVPIGDLLTRNRDKVSIEDGRVYKRVTIKLYGGGAMIRDLRRGEEIGTKNQYLVKKGQFLFSRIDARNGAFAVATDEIDNAIVTNDFPIYDIDRDLADPNYLALLTSNNRFSSFVQSVSSGTTNRQRLDENAFLNFRIPLPPVKAQEELFCKYNESIQDAEENEERARALDDEIADFLFDQLHIRFEERETHSHGLQFVNFNKLSRWSLEYLYQKEGVDNLYTSKYETLPLGCMAEGVSGGTPPKAVSEYWNGTIPWVSPKDMKTESILKTQYYISEAAIKASSAPLIAKGSILFVVRSGILQNTVPVAINQVPVSINQDLRAYRLKDSRIALDYLFLFLRHGQRILLQLVKNSTTVQSIDSGRLESLRIPCPPRSVQRAIVEHVVSIKSEITRLIQEATTLRADAQEEFESKIFVSKNLA